jgi:hypothetical protein
LAAKPPAASPATQALLLLLPLPLLLLSQPPQHATAAGLFQMS